jgi:hypothetical protein
MKGSRLRRKLLTAVIAAVVSLSLVPQQVGAADYDGYCDNNEVCVYKDANLGTPRSDFLYYYPDMDGGINFHTYNYPSSCNTIPGWWDCRLNDSISSVDSWSDHRSIRIFTDAYYDGNYQTIRIYGRVMQVQYNDQTSSDCWNDGGITYAVDPDCTFSN